MYIAACNQAAFSVPQLQTECRSLLQSHVLPAAQLLYIAICHLEGSPYRPSDRVSQIRSVLERLQRHQADHHLGPAECPMLVIGDLNSSRHDSVCQLLYR